MYYLPVQKKTEILLYLLTLQKSRCHSSGKDTQTDYLIYLLPRELLHDLTG